MSYSSDNKVLDDLFDDRARHAKEDHKYAKSRSNRAYSDRYLNQNINNRSNGDMLRAASGMPQAVLKISGYCKGKSHVDKHIKYISRYGELPLIDQDGSIIKGISAQKDLLADWQSDFGTRKNSRDIAKIVLSVPEGSPPDKLMKAVKIFLNNEYGNSNEYVYVLHTDTKKPHVHVAVKMMSYQGKKLDPRKHYIEKLRRDFAKFCREQGILVEASRRYQRGKAKKFSRETNKLKYSNYTPNSKKYSKEIIPDRNKVIRQEYIKSALDLQDLADKSNDTQDKSQYQKSANILLEFAKNMPTEQSDCNKNKGITFKEYSQILARLDENKRKIINQIEANKSQKISKNIDMSLDI